MKKKASDRVVEYIQKMISDGVWEPGSKIYTETELQEHTGVGKASVREAVEKLCAMGLLEKRQGDGTYVKEFKLSQFVEKLLPALTLDSQNIRDILEYRMIVEPVCVQKFIENYDPVEAGRLEETVIRMKRCQESGDNDGVHKADNDFHYIITNGSRNEIIINTMTALREVMLKYHYTASRTIGIKAGIVEHTAILDAIRNHDAELGFLLMQRHLKRSMDDMETYERTKV